jgi:hypothetical protein
MTGCWRCGRSGGLVQGRTGLCHGQVYGTHCNTPGPCVTPARKCNARAGGAPTRAGGGTGGQPTPTPVRPHIGRLPGADIRPHRRRSRRITQSTHATPGAATPTPAQTQSRGPLCPHRQVPFAWSLAVCLVLGLSAYGRLPGAHGGSNTPAPADEGAPTGGSGQTSCAWRRGPR